MSNSSATVAPVTAYMFDNATAEARNQLRHLGEVLDSHSQAVLRQIGLGAGWRVTDIGAGGGTLTSWLAQQVGPDGHVTAIDLDPRYIDERPNVTITAGDVRTLPLPEGSQDAIIARLVLMHLPEREEVLVRLVSALKPGAPIIISDWDCTWRDMVRRSPSPRVTELLEKFQDALLSFGEARGADMAWANQCVDVLSRIGLTDVTGFIDSRSWAGGTGICLLHRSNSIQKEAELLAAGMSLDELVELREALMDPGLVLSSYLMHTTVGRRPASAPTG